MHLTQVAQFVVAGSWPSIRARCWSFAIVSRTIRRAGTRGLLFLRLMQQAVDLSPVPAKEIRGGRRPSKNQQIDVT